MPTPKITKQAIAEALRAANVSLTDWFDQCDRVNDVLYTFNSPIYFEWGQENVQVTAFIHNLSFRVIIEDDAFKTYGSDAEFAEDIMRYQNEALFLEKHIPTLEWSKLKEFLEAIPK